MKQLKMKWKAMCTSSDNRVLAVRVMQNGVIESKHDITDTASLAVAEHLLKAREEVHFNYDGEQYALRVVKVNP